MGLLGGEAGLARGEDFLHVFLSRSESAEGLECEARDVDATDGGWRMRTDEELLLASAFSRTTRSQQQQ